MFASEYIVLIVTCCLWRFDLDFRDFNKKVGLELSDTKMGTGFQDAITPPKLNWLSYVVYFVLIATLITAYFDRGGFKTVLICLGIIFLFPPIAGVLILEKLKFKKKLDKIYLRILLHSMINRHADYVKNNDTIRADAMKGLLNKLKKKYKKQISELAKNK